MYIEMELLAREQYERRLREARETNLHRSLVGYLPKTARAGRHLPMPRLRRR